MKTYKNHYTVDQNFDVYKALRRAEHTVVPFSAYCMYEIVCICIRILTHIEASAAYIETEIMHHRMCEAWIYQILQMPFLEYRH